MMLVNFFVQIDGIQVIVFVFVDLGEKGNIFGGIQGCQLQNFFFVV